MVVDVPDTAVASLLIGDLFYANVAWICLEGYAENTKLAGGFKKPHDAWTVNNEGTVVDGLYSFVEAIRSQTVAKTLPTWLARPIASTEILVQYYDLPKRILASLNGSDQEALHKLEKATLDILLDDVYGFECDGYIAEVEWQDLDGFDPQNIRVTNSTKPEMLEHRFTRKDKCAAFRAVDEKKLLMIESLKAEEDSTVQNKFYKKELENESRYDQGVTVPISVVNYASPVNKDTSETRVLSTLCVYPNNRATVGFPKWKIALLESFVRGLKEAHAVWQKAKQAEMKSYLKKFESIAAKKQPPSILVMGPPGAHRAHVALTLTLTLTLTSRCTPRPRRRGPCQKTQSAKSLGRCQTA